MEEKEIKEQVKALKKSLDKIAEQIDDVTIEKAGIMLMLFDMGVQMTMNNLQSYFKEMNKEKENKESEEK